MGWKYDKDNDEWITTEEYNEREAQATGMIIALIAIIIAPILPARIIKWLFGYGFLPDLGFWQYVGDLFISLPVYAVIAVAVYFIRENLMDD